MNKSTMILGAAMLVYAPPAYAQVPLPMYGIGTTTALAITYERQPVGLLVRVGKDGITLVRSPREQYQSLSGRIDAALADGMSRARAERVVTPDCHVVPLKR